MKIDRLPVDLQIAAAVAQKAQSVQKLEGQAAIDLIESAAATAPTPTADGRGTVINTRA